MVPLRRSLIVKEHGTAYGRNRSLSSVEAGERAATPAEQLFAVWLWQSLLLQKYFISLRKYHCITSLKNKYLPAAKGTR